MAVVVPIRNTPDRYEGRPYRPGIWYNARGAIDWDYVPATVWGLVQGWEEHSGATWGRLQRGLIKHANFQWNEDDIRRIAEDDRMHGWQMTHWMMVDWPKVPEEIRE